MLMRADVRDGKELSFSQEQRKVDLTNAYKRPAVLAKIAQFSNFYKCRHEPICLLQQS